MAKSALHGLLHPALLALPMVITLLWAPPGTANDPGRQPAPGTASAAAAADRVTAARQGSETGKPALQPSAAAAAAQRDDRKDLTVFFSIGAAVNVVMLTVFLVWAVRQWRKTKH